ncbi:hypothetical protein XA68_18223 [Ophiocordyceps unilateralis]|uniref:Uncharacterized protein n=1 Tax=Ophiocordyceps unilateralis TaxID=268505 RepID=A0A2A9PSA7_OPHUN|nr:hypothetical protein XA68_18223 [Ophiocordyceps unilateralis]
MPVRTRHLPWSEPAGHAPSPGRSAFPSGKTHGLQHRTTLANDELSAYPTERPMAKNTTEKLRDGRRIASRGRGELVSDLVKDSIHLLPETALTLRKLPGGLSQKGRRRAGSKCVPLGEDALPAAQALQELTLANPDVEGFWNDPAYISKRLAPTHNPQKEWHRKVSAMLEINIRKLGPNEVREIIDILANRLVRPLEITTLTGWN